MIKRLLASSLLLSLPCLAAETPAPKEPLVPLHELLVSALNQNLELGAKRLDPQMQDQRVTAAWGAFDPTLVAGATAERVERPKTKQETDSSGFSSIFGGTTEKIVTEENVHLQAGVTGRLPFGTTYQVLTSGDRLRNIYNKFDSEYVSDTTLTITQPLLRDFGFAANLAEVRIQKITSEAARLDLQATAQRILRDVASAYYEMAFAQENIRVKQEAVDVAASLVRENQRRLDEGRMAQIDVTLAQSRLSEAREDLVVAENFLSQRRNTLRELTASDFSKTSGDFLVDPAFITREPPKIDRNAALALIFTHNPAYLSSVAQAKSEDIRIAYAKNQRWPRVDLKASIGYNGLSSFGFDDSYKNYYQRNDPNWTAGVVVNIPVFNRTGRANLSIARMHKVQTLLDLKRAENTLLSAFDTAIRDIANATERIQLVHDSVQLADATLQSEIKRLASGLTTSYNVSQAQRDLSQARSRELATFVDLNKAIAQWEFVLGTLPEHLRVNFVNN